jgi:hypothetical protein
MAASNKSKKDGRKCQLTIDEGGHDFPKADDIEAALKWLAQETAGKPGKK